METAVERGAREAITVALEAVQHRLTGHRAALAHVARLGWPPALVESGSAALIRAAELEVVVGLLEGVLEGARIQDDPD